MHTNSCFVDYDILFRRYSHFSEECKKLSVDDKTARKIRYLNKCFREKRAELKRMVSESSDPESST